MDFKEAFDCLSQQCFTAKKKDLGISGRLWSWFRIYQSTHVQHVRIGETPNNISVCRWCTMFKHYLFIHGHWYTRPQNDLYEVSLWSLRCKLFFNKKVTLYTYTFVLHSDNTTTYKIKWHSNWIDELIVNCTIKIWAYSA